jgi:hypothetical protein
LLFEDITEIDDEPYRKHHEAVARERSQGDGVAANADDNHRDDELNNAKSYEALWVERDVFSSGLALGRVLVVGVHGDGDVVACIETTGKQRMAHVE